MLKVKEALRDILSESDEDIGHSDLFDYGDGTKMNF